MDNLRAASRAASGGVPRCSLRARGGSSPCSPCSAQAGLRVAARGSGPGAQAAPPLPSAARRSHREVSGRRASRHIDAKRACRPSVEQRADRGKQGSQYFLPPTPADDMAFRGSRIVVQRPRRVFGYPTSGQGGNRPLVASKAAGQVDLQAGQVEVAHGAQRVGCQRVRQALRQPV